MQRVTSESELLLKPCIVPTAVTFTVTQWVFFPAVLEKRFVFPVCTCLSIFSTTQRSVMHASPVMERAHQYLMLEVEQNHPLRNMHLINPFLVLKFKNLTTKSQKMMHGKLWVMIFSICLLIAQLSNTVQLRNILNNKTRYIQDHIGWRQNKTPLWIK